MAATRWNVAVVYIGALLLTVREAAAYLSLLGTLRGHGGSSRQLQDAAELAPTNSTGEEGVECGVWLEGKEFFGSNIRAPHGDVASRLACLLLCIEEPGCNAVTMNEQDVDPLCYLKRIEENFEPVDFESNLHGASLRLCPEQQNKEPFDESSIESASQPGEEDVCGQWLEDFTVEGAVVPGVAEKEVPHKADCLHLCHSSPDCTAAIFNYRTKLCRVVVADPDAQPESEPDWVVIQICPQQQTSECGKWITDGDYFGHDIPGAGSFAVDRDTCMSLCERKEGCNAVTFKKFTQKCWLKELPPGETYLADWESDTIALCPADVPEPGPGAGDNSARTGIIAGVSAAAAAALMALGGLYWLLFMRRSNDKHDPHASQEVGHSSMVRLHSTAQHATSKDTACLVAVSPYGGQKVPTGGSLGSAQQSTGLPVSGASGAAPELLGASSDTTSKTTSREHSERATTRVSTWHVSALPVPSEGAAADVVMNFVHNQLDRVEAAHNQDGSAAEILDGLKFTGSGPQDRLQGGQAIVQMAHSRMNRVDYAIKFFVSRPAFEQERALYSGSSPLGQFLPQVRNVVGNDGGDVVDPGGHPLPPCIVMERGESLDLWSDRNAPDRAQAFTVIYHIAQRMAEFHAAGFVHRDLKPGNVMWLPRANRWTVIDFGCAALRKRKAPIAYTLRYAAPEVIDAKRGGEAEMVVEEALDAWSLGVMAFEMCVGSTPFPRGMPADAIMDQIQGVGHEVLPWEGERLTAEVQGKLRLFRGALLQLLHRDPRQRPSMAHFCRTCAKMLGDHTE